MAEANAQIKSENGQPTTVKKGTTKENAKTKEATATCLEAKVKMGKVEDVISTIVGLDDLKLQLRDWAKGMLLDTKRRALRLQISQRNPPHMAFLGNPGTGKTMVARAFGKLLNEIGILPTDRVTEVQRTDLVGEYIGQTGPKTRLKLEEAKGGILFVDEAYRLMPYEGKSKDYGVEALEEIMSWMDSGKIVVIFAGYTEPMKRVFSSNSGFNWRVTKTFIFDDLDAKDLASIALLKMNNQTEGSPLFGFKLHPTCTEQAITSLIAKEATKKQRKEMNGGLVEPMLMNARENLDRRLDLDTMDADDLLTITLEDLEEGLISLDEEKRKKRRREKKQASEKSKVNNTAEVIDLTTLEPKAETETTTKKKPAKKQKKR